MSDAARVVYLSEDAYGALAGIKEAINNLVPGEGDRRERIATAVLAGLIAYPGGVVDANDPAGFAKRAVTYADALIAELDK